MFTVEKRNVTSHLSRYEYIYTFSIYDDADCDRRTRRENLSNRSISFWSQSDDDRGTDGREISLFDWLTNLRLENGSNIVHPR